MYCLMCGQKFCYLCGTMLSRRDPYAHFRNEELICFGLLFEGENLNALFPQIDELDELLGVEEEGMFDDADM